jgi:hypothetical protein
VRIIADSRKLSSVNAMTLIPNHRTGTPEFEELWREIVAALSHYRTDEY